MSAAAPASRVARVAYLVSRYPKPSHSFVRSEILGLERLGVEVLRFTVKPCEEELVDARDRAERLRTRALLGRGALGLLPSVLGLALTRPRRFTRALGLVWRLGRGTHAGLARHLGYLGEACRLASWLAREPVAHLHAHFGNNPAAIAALCHSLGGPPWSFTVHGTDSYEAPGELRLGKKLAEARFALSVCEQGRAQLMRWSEPADWERIHVVRCGVGEEFLREQAPAPAPREEPPRVVCVARLSVEKAHLVLLEAVARLAREGQELELVLVGDGPLRAAIEARVRALGLARRVHLRGWLAGDAVRAEILAARGLVLPSFAEGLPVVLMEALALHRPVIASAVGGVPELVREGREGWLVPPGSVEALAEALRALVRAAPEELARLGASGAARVRRLHDGAANAAALLALVRRAHEGAALEREAAEIPSASAERKLDPRAAR